MLVGNEAFPAQEHQHCRSKLHSIVFERIVNFSCLVLIRLPPSTDYRRFGVRPCGMCHHLQAGGEANTKDVNCSNKNFGVFYVHAG
jgi:hypothetical protein